MSPAPIKLSSLVEVLNAAHLTYCVQSPFQQRSGIMLVCPPGQLKTSALETLDINYHNYLLLSDLNQPALTSMKDDMFSGNYQTIGFKDMIKLYERNPAVAANLEGTLRSMVEEGWSGAAFQNPSMAKQAIRVLIMGTMTPKMYESKYQHWKDTGFSRRFIWCHYALREPWRIGDAIQKQEMLPISFDPIRIPTAGSLSTASLEDKEKREIRSWLKLQPGNDGSPFNLLLKIASVLKWHYSRRRPEQNFMVKLREFARTLQNEYVLVDIDEEYLPAPKARNSNTVTNSDLPESKVKNATTKRDVAAPLPKVQKNRTAGTRG